MKFSGCSGTTVKRELVHIDDDSTDITEENYQTIDSIPGSHPTPEEHTEGIYSIILYKCMNTAIVINMSRAIVYSIQNA